MKRIMATMLMAASLSSFAQDNQYDALYIVMNNGVTNTIPLGNVNEITFNEAGDKLIVNGTWEVSLDEITELTYGATGSELTINYNGTEARAVNPFFMDGVSVSVNGADVVVNNENTTAEIKTVLSGETSNGLFQYNGTYKTSIVLNGLSLTNTRGAAIDIQCGKRIALDIKKETVNTLVDGKNGEQKAALYCKGHLEIDKAGTLNVTGNTAHAISAKEYIKLKKSDGTINILGAVKDGIHCKQYFLANGFNVNIDKAGGDGIDVELDGEANEDGYEDGSLNINSGSFTITSSADTIKGLKADSDINIAAGTLNIAMSGKGSMGMKADNNINIGLSDDSTGPALTVSTSGSSYSDTSSSTSTFPWGGGGNRPGGGGPGGGGMFGESTGTSSKAIKAMNTVNIYGGSLTVTTQTDGAEGVEGKQGVNINGGKLYLKCYDDCINSGGKIFFNGGTTVCWSNGNDAIDSNAGTRGAITIAGGNVFSYSTKGSPEEGFDCDNNSYIVVTDGIAVSAGGSQGGGMGSSSSSIGSSSQGYYLGSSPSSYTSSRYYTLCSTDGTAICTYKFEANCSNSLSLLTAPNLGKGSVTVKYGTSKPTACSDSVGEVFWINPTVTTSGTTATITAK